MITAIALMIAAFLNAIMDRCENESIFSTKLYTKWKDKPVFNSFIYKRESWKVAKKIFSWKFDLWHTAKSAMLFFLFIAIIAYNPVFNWWKDFLVAAIIWLTVFNITYNRILKA
jgi:hypothetical protein